MQKSIEETRIVISHGELPSFIAPLQLGKIPIVVPWQKGFDEQFNSVVGELMK